MVFPHIHRLAIRRESLLLAWVGLLSWAAAAMCAGLFLAGYRIGHPLATGLLAVLAIAAEREAIRLTPTVEVSVASSLCVFAAVVFGPLSAVIVAGCGLLADLPRRDTAQPILRWTTWTAIKMIVAGAVGLAAVAVTGAALARFLGPVRSSGGRVPRRDDRRCLPDRRRTSDSGDITVGGDGPHHRAGPSRERSAAGANGGRSCLFVRDDLSVECRSLRNSGLCRSEAAPSVPEAARDVRGTLVREYPTRERQLLLRDRACRHPRRTRPLYGWSLSIGSDLCSRHRGAARPVEAAAGAGPSLWARTRRREDWPARGPS